MTNQWYTGTGRRSTDGPATLPASPLDRHTHPAGYLADRGLVDAVNVALHLGQPLLLTGQAGTGKTQLANSLAWELGYEAPLKFETKSTSVARDLFYTYDAVGRFYAAQTGQGSPNAIDYIRFNALGLAILRANPPDDLRHLLGGQEAHDAPRRSVVLIDEIDKAPRDFPNDLLNEVEGTYFRIPELGNVTVTARPELRPILVLTSNSEKNLAEAFLRRCVFYHLPFPDDDRLVRIVYSRLGEAITRDGDLLKDALDIFHRLRAPIAALSKKPSTAELLAWLRILTAAGGNSTLRKGGEALIEPALCCLVKTVEDRPKATEILREWLQSTSR